MDLDLNTLGTLADNHLPGLLFVTVSGSHLYGFSSLDSDVDLRGTFLSPLENIVGLIPTQETVERKLNLGGVEVELVAHEARSTCTCCVGTTATFWNRSFRRSWCAARRSYPGFGRWRRNASPVVATGTTAGSSSRSANCSTRRT